MREGLTSCLPKTGNFTIGILQYYYIGVYGTKAIISHLLYEAYRRCCEREDRINIFPGFKSLAGRNCSEAVA